MRKMPMGRLLPREFRRTSKTDILKKVPAFTRMNPLTRSRLYD